MARPSCLLHVKPSVTADEYLGAVAGLYDALDSTHASPRLGIFGLTGEAILLGRHQRLASAVDASRARELNLPVLRRHTGGRTLAVGQGTVALVIALPHPSALVGSPIPLSKALNRYVRGVLAMGMILKAPTYYFARDFVSLASKQAGYLTLDARPSGATIIEVLLSVSRTFALPDGLSSYPPREDGVEPPAHTTYQETSGRPLEFDEVRAALVKGFERTYSIDLTDAGEAPQGALLEVKEDEAGFASSGLGEIAIGYLEGLVKRSGDSIGEARLRGDFICPAEAIRRLERAVQGEPLRYLEIGRKVDEVFKDPFATLMGVKHLRIIPDALVAAGQPEA